MCFAAASWLLQEDLAERRETCVNDCPAVLQLLLHCENVDTLQGVSITIKLLWAACAWQEMLASSLGTGWAEQEGRKQPWNFVTYPQCLLQAAEPSGAD